MDSAEQPYRVVISPLALPVLRHLPTEVVARVRHELHSLAELASTMPIDSTTGLFRRGLTGLPALCFTVSPWMAFYEVHRRERTVVLLGLEKQG